MKFKSNVLSFCTFSSPLEWTHQRVCLCHHFQQHPGALVWSSWARQKRSHSRLQGLFVLFYVWQLFTLFIEFLWKCQLFEQHRSSLYCSSPECTRWCTKRRTLTRQSTSGQWKGTPPIVSSWLAWGSTFCTRSRFWLSQGSEMDGPALRPSWRGLWMMVGFYVWDILGYICLVWKGLEIWNL